MEKIIKQVNRIYIQSDRGLMPISNFEEKLKEQIKPEWTPLGFIYNYCMKKDLIKKIYFYKNILPLFDNDSKEPSLEYYFNFETDKWELVKDDTSLESAYFYIANKVLDYSYITQNTLPVR